MRDRAAAHLLLGMDPEQTEPDPVGHSGDQLGCPRVPEEVARFVELVNRGEFWESHEVLEGPWRQLGSDFYQGLILYASAFVHAQRGNRHGITAQLEKAEERLHPHRPFYLGVDVEGIFEHAARCRRIVRANPDVARDAWKSLIPFPRLTLLAERMHGDEPELAGGSR